MQEEGICGTNELLCTNCLLSGLLFTVILGTFLWWICGLNTETNEEDEAEQAGDDQAVDETNDETADDENDVPAVDEDAEANVDDQSRLL